MTFIVSVIARDGVAIVVDSFTTTMARSMDLNDFEKYLDESEAGEIDLKKLLKLFKEKPSYTRNYAEKLTKYDKYTAITSAGHAYINGVLVKDLMIKASKKLQKSSGYTKQTIEEKIDDLVKELEIDIRKHIKKAGVIDTCEFIVSHYNKKESKAQIFKITVKPTTSDELNDPKREFINIKDESRFGVVASGQDRIIDRMLFGSLYKTATELTRKVAGAIFKEMNSRKATRKRVLDKLFPSSTDDFVLIKDIREDLNMVSIRELRLQEAVNFAALLMRIVRDIQAYTENTPTVGGLIKIAVISKEDGYTDIQGHEILAPEIVQ